MSLQRTLAITTIIIWKCIDLIWKCPYFLPLFCLLLVLVGWQLYMHACMCSVLISCFAEFVELSTEGFAGIQHDQLLY